MSMREKLVEFVAVPGKSSEELLDILIASYEEIHAEVRRLMLVEEAAKEVVEWHMPRNHHVTISKLADSLALAAAGVPAGGVA